MSDMKHILEIKPNPHGARTETRYASGFACPCCSGQGGFRDTNTITGAPSLPATSATAQAR